MGFMKKRYKKSFKWLEEKLKNFHKNPQRANPGSQAYRVVCKFGGPKKIQEALALLGHKIALTTIYGWMNDARYTVNGLIPQFWLEDLIYVARFVGILLLEDDLDPRFQISEEEAEAYHEVIGVFKNPDVSPELKKARKAALIKELYEKERDRKIKSEEEVLKERKEYIVKYRKMHEAARKHFKDKRGNETNE